LLKGRYKEFAGIQSIEHLLTLRTMNKLFLLLLSMVTTSVFAQDQDVKTLQETAKTFQRQGDYSNAILVLNKAMEKEPANLKFRRNLPIPYYLNHDYDKALKIR
jgi:hypothetical protein